LLIQKTVWMKRLERRGVMAARRREKQVAMRRFQAARQQLIYQGANIKAQVRQRVMPGADVGRLKMWRRGPRWHRIQENTSRRIAKGPPNLMAK
jgi:hypothetical protein